MGGTINKDKMFPPQSSLIKYPPMKLTKIVIIVAIIVFGACCACCYVEGKQFYKEFKERRKNNLIIKCN